MRFLILSPVFPLPVNTGTKVRLFNLIRALKAGGHAVGLISNIQPSEMEHAEELRELCDDLVLRVINDPGADRSWPTRLKRLGRVAGTCALGTPLFAALVRHPELEDALVRLSPAYDAVLVEFFFTALNVPDSLLQRLGHRAALVEHDISFVPKRRAFEVAPWPEKPASWLRYRSWRLEEMRQLRRFRTVIAMSGHDRDELLRLAPHAEVIVAPNGVDTTRIVPAPGSRPVDQASLLFVGGMGHAPNLDAMRHFILEHMPVLRRTIPGVNLTIVGNTAGCDISGLNAPDVRFAGFVEDLAPLYGSCLASVAPFRVGGGTRLKILESMAAGLPVISSAVGAEGLPLRHAETCLFAETPEETATAILALQRESGLADALSASARRLCVERFDWSAIAADLERDMNHLMEKHRAL